MKTQGRWVLCIQKNLSHVPWRHFFLVTSRRDLSRREIPCKIRINQRFFFNMSVQPTAKEFFLIILRLELNDPQSGREVQVEWDNLWGDRSCYTMAFEGHLNIVLDYLTVNVRATGSFEISVTIYRSAWRNTQKELHLQNSKMKADTRQIKNISVSLHSLLRVSASCSHRLPSNSTTYHVSDALTPVQYSIFHILCLIR